MLTQTVNLRKIFRVQHPDWTFKGILLWEELAKLEMKVFSGEISEEQLRFVHNAVELTKELPDEQFEHNQIAYVLLRYVEKMSQDPNA